MSTELPIPRIAVSPETLRRLQAQIDAVIAAWRRFAEAACELLAAAFADMTRALDSATWIVEHARPAPPRRGWQSTYGPAHQKRGRR